MRLLAVFLGLLFVGQARASDLTPFSRVGEPQMIAVGPTAVNVPMTFPQRANTILIINPLKCDMVIRTYADSTSLVTPASGVIQMARTANTFAITMRSYFSAMTLTNDAGAACSGSVELVFGTGQ